MPRGVAAKISRGRAPLAVADQILISGSNFLTSIVLVRGLGLTEFGKYSAAYIFLLYANALQMSFIAFPMLSLAPLMAEKEKKLFVKGMFTMQLIASGLLCVVFAAGGLIFRLFSSMYTVPIILAFGLTVGVFQAQDWLRRYYFLQKKGGFALASDFISYFVQLIILFALWRLGRLNLFSTFVTMFATSLAAFSLGFVTDRLTPSMEHIRATWDTSKALSRDLLIANQVRWFGLQGVLLIGTGIVGISEIGGLRATMSLAGPVNLVLTSLENVIPIRVAEILKSGGAQQACDYVRRAIYLSVLGLGPVLLVVALFGHSILRVVYGPAMVPFYLPMLLQLLGVFVMIAGRLWLFFFRGVQDGRAMLWANALSAFASISTIWVFGRLWGGAGIVGSSLSGQVIIVVFSMFYWARHQSELTRKFPEVKVSTREEYPSTASIG
jgi:O-antigen/teichoic acid export membrane protein